MKIPSKEEIAQKSNGCSGMVSWFYAKIMGRTPSFESCCDIHDIAYYDGGFLLYHKVRADYTFYQCMKERKRPFKALLFFVAVSSTFGVLAWYWNRIQQFYRLWKQHI